MSVEFEPVTLRPRRRRVDPVAIGAFVVVIGLVVAVLKPWNAGADPAGSGPDQAIVASSSAPGASGSPGGPRATAAPVLPRILTASTASLAAWDRVRAALSPHDAWGIRAIVAEPSASLAPAPQQFAEHWDAVPDDPAGLPTIDIEPNERTVVAIGITFPAAHTPLDARIWLVHPDRLEWIDTQAVDPDPSGGAFLYRVADREGTVQNWGAGRYRIDVLVDGGIRRFGFTLPNRFDIVPDRSEPAVQPGGLVDPAQAALPDLRIGLFASTEGVSLPLAADAGPPLTEVGAWLNVDPGTGRAPRSFVSAVRLSAATGLGVMLPPGSRVQRSAIRRLAPAPLGTDAELVQNVAATHGSLNPHVLYRPPGGGAWTPGVYRLSVLWLDSAGTHDQSWHIELRPGPVRELPPLLLATRGFARYAGERGIVVGTAEPLEGGPRSVAIRLLQSRSPASTAAPANDPVTCAGVRVDGFAGVAGVAYPVDAAPPSLTARAFYDSSRSFVQPILVAARNSPGLELVVLVEGAAPASFVYRLRIGGETGTPGTTACLWTAPAG